MQQLAAETETAMEMEMGSKEDNGDACAGDI